MSIITLLVTLVVIGVLLWGVNAIDQIDPKIKKIINVLVVVLVVLWLVNVFFGHAYLPRLR